MGVCWLTLVELCMCVCYSGTCCRETTVQKCLINKEKEMQIDTGFVWSLPIFSCFYASMLLFVSSSARDSQTPRARAWGLRACCVEGASTAKEETCWAPGGEKGRLRYTGTTRRGRTVGRRQSGRAGGLPAGRRTRRGGRRGHLSRGRPSRREARGRRARGEVRRRRASRKRR